MTDAPSPKTDRDDVAVAMRLRPDPPKVMRLSRKSLLIGGGLLAVAASAVLAITLRAPNRPTPVQELYRPAVSGTDVLSSLPKDYAGPVLGPPLPGDLGRPILAAGQKSDWDDRAGPSSLPEASMEDDVARGARQAREAAAESHAAALQSGLFLQTGGRSSAASPQGHDDPGGPNAPTTTGAAPEDLWPGAIISGALVTGLRSDLRGPVLAQVTETVHDSRTGERIVIPRGSRLIGAYDAEVGYGQSRLRIVWTRLVTPDGRTVELSGAEASDPSGYAGLEDRVDNRWGERLRAAGLTTLLSVSTASTKGDHDDRLVRAVREGAGRGVDQVGREVLSRSLSVPPRLTVRPGYRFHIILTEGLSLPSSGD